MPTPLIVSVFCLDCENTKYLGTHELLALETREVEVVLPDKNSHLLLLSAESKNIETSERKKIAMRLLAFPQTEGYQEIPTEFVMGKSINVTFERENITELQSMIQNNEILFSDIKSLRLEILENAISASGLK